MTAGQGAGTAGHDPVAESFDWLTGVMPALVLSVGPSAPGFERADHLFDPSSQMLASLLAYQASFSPGMDEKTKAAYLVGQYVYFLCLSAGAAYLKHGVFPDFSASRLALRLEQPADMLDAFRRYHFRFLRDAPPHAGRDAFRHMLESHAGGLVSALAQISRLGRGALWRIVGDALAAAFLEIGNRLGAVDHAVAEATALLKQPGSPLRNKEMRFLTLSISVDDGPSAEELTETFRLRGGCCRFYKTDGGSICTTCVLNAPDEQERGLKAFMLENHRRGDESPA